MNDKTLVIGAAVIDNVVTVDRLPLTGEDIYGSLAETVVGGCGYNVQRVLTKFEQPVDFLCPIGSGQYAEFIKKDFGEKGIKLLITDSRMDNGWNISFVEADGERTFLSLPGIEFNWLSEWFETIDINDYRYVYVSGYELEGPSGEVIVSELAKIRNTDQTKIVFDPSPRAEFLDDTLLSSLYKLKPIIHCNQSELATLSAEADINTGIQKLFKATATEVVVTTGEKGATLFDGTKIINIASEKVNVVDTIGAGDSHTAGYIVGKQLGFSSEKSCQLANHVSGAIVANATGNFEDLNSARLLALLDF